MVSPDTFGRTEDTTPAIGDNPGRPELLTLPKGEFTNIPRNQFGT